MQRFRCIKNLKFTNEFIFFQSEDSVKDLLKEKNHELVEKENEVM